MQEKIKYSEIKNLGFIEEEVNDVLYFEEHGFQYCEITKRLTKRIALEWEKSTQLCFMAIGKKHSIYLVRIPINNIKELRNIIEFFTLN